MTEKDIVLEVKDLHTYFFNRRGVTKAVDGVSFSVREGETLGIVGESGCGKTMTALSLLRLIPKPAARIVSGEILLDGEDLVSLSDKDIRQVRGRKISMILQDPQTSLNPVFTIGMKQRVIGAIAVSATPKIIIADEPTTALDVTIQLQYLRLLKDIQAETGLAIIFITHDFGIVARMCDRVAVMYAGRIVEQADVRDLFNKPHHPYTQALMDSVPKMDRTDRLRAIDGQPPFLWDLPEGCRFAPRCINAREVCTKSYPEITMHENNHSVACFMSQPEWDN
jgi:peptide/nickel transport system ATP-binding protein